MLYQKAMIALAAAALLGFTVNASASTKIGGKYYHNSFGSSTTATIFTNSQNVGGIHLQTVVLSCYQNAELDAVSPSAASEKIAFCPSTSTGYGNTQLQGIVLPAGWGLNLVTGSSNGNPEVNNLYLTYDAK